MSSKRNAEGYSDPVVYTALSRIEKEEQYVRQLKKLIGEICSLSGYRLKGQITLVDKKNGHSIRM